MSIKNLLYIVRFITKHRMYSLVKFLSLSAGWMAAMIVWLYTVNYNQEVRSLGEFIERCTLSDIMTMIAVLLVMSAGYVLIFYSQRDLRTNEILVRKLYGDCTSNIILDIMIETLLFVVLSFIISLAIIDQLVPLLNLITSKDVFIRGSMNLQMVFFLLAFIFGISMTCGLLPAYLYARIRPVQILNKKRRVERNYS